MILAIGWGVCVLYGFPGVMPLEAFEQLREGRDWVFTDRHPPAMTALWGIVDRIVPGPLGMLVIQSGMFLVGLYWILRRAMPLQRAAIWACVVYVFPPIVAPLAVIGKDCLMAGFLVLGIAAVLDERRWVRVLGLVAFTAATAMRSSALAATLPLVVLLFEWQPGRRWYVRSAIAAGTWLAITAVALGCNALLTDRKMYSWHRSLALADIAGVLSFVDTELPDAELRPLLAPTELRVERDIHGAVRAKYKSDDFRQLISGEGRLWDAPRDDPMPAPRRDAIDHARSTLVRDHPGAYVRYRLESFGETLGVNRKYAGGTIVRHRAQDAGLLDHMGLGRGWSRYQEIGEAITTWFARRTRLFRPHGYALLGLGLLLLCRRNRDVFAILLSGLTLELSMLPLGATPDARSSLWLVTCTCVGLVMLIARRMRAPA